MASPRHGAAEGHEHEAGASLLHEELSARLRGKPYRRDSFLGAAGAHTATMATADAGAGAGGGVAQDALTARVLAELARAVPPTP